jgi:hypothetical protein
LRLLLGSLWGKWPYKCGACGREFVLAERAPRSTKSRGERKDAPAGSGSREGTTKTE